VEFTKHRPSPFLKLKVVGKEGKAKKKKKNQEGISKSIGYKENYGEKETTD
jgi:hypothetical protein